MMVTQARWLAVVPSPADPTWPWQAVLILAGVTGLALAARGATPGAARWVPALLAFLWLSMAVAAVTAAASEASPLGFAWAAALLAQGVLFGRQALGRGLAFDRRRGRAAWVGVGLAAYALLVQPVFFWASNATSSVGQWLALTPGSLVIYTIGVLLLTRPRAPTTLIALPLAIALSGPLWAKTSLPEGIALATSGVAGLWLIAARSAGPRAGRPPQDTAAPPHRGWSLDLTDEA